MHWDSFTKLTNNHSDPAADNPTVTKYNDELLL